MNMTVESLLRRHRVTRKTYAANGKEYSKLRIQVSFAKGKKKEISGNDSEDLKHKIQEWLKSLSIGFEELVDTFLNDEAYLKSAPKTYPFLIKYSSKKFKPFFNDQPVNTIEEETVIDACKHIKESDVSRRTFYNIVHGLLVLFDYAVGKGYLSKNPAKGLGHKGKECFLRNHLSESEIVEFINLSFLHPLGNFFKLALLSGIPMDKLLAISWKDVDFKNNSITINKAFESIISFSIKRLGNRNIYKSYQPQIVMNILKGELEEQSRDLEMKETILLASNKQIINLRIGSDRFRPISFASKLNYFLNTKMKSKHTYSDVFFTSAVIAINARCDMTSVSDTVGMRMAFEMYKDLGKYGCYYQTENNGVCKYFDEELYKRSALLDDCNEETDIKEATQCFEAAC